MLSLLVASIALSGVPHLERSLPSLPSFKTYPLMFPRVSLARPHRSPNVVGLANATSAGWGNLGGGITQFLSSALYIALLTSYSPFQSWRRVFFILGCFHVVGGLLVLVLGQDTPDANYADLRAAGHMRKLNAQDATRVFYAGVLNYRT